MYDYRRVQIQDLEKKIEETHDLLADPSLKEMAEKEIIELRAQKKALEEAAKTDAKEREVQIKCLSCKGNGRETFRDWQSGYDYEVNCTKCMGYGTITAIRA